MNPKIRIETILLIERIKSDPEYARRIELTDSSHYRSGTITVAAETADGYYSERRI